MGMMIEGLLSENLAHVWAAEIRCRVSLFSGSWCVQIGRSQDGKLDEGRIVTIVPELICLHALYASLCVRCGNFSSRRMYPSNGEYR